MGLRKFFGTVGVYTCRAVLSPRFLGCVIVSALLMISFVQSDYNYHFPNTAMYYFYMGIEVSGSGELLLMLAAMPAVTLFCEDHNSGEFLLLYSRTGKKIYPFAVIFSSGIIAALSITVTYLIFSAYILAGYPLVPQMEAAQLRRETLGMQNSGLLTGSAPVLFYVLWIAVKSAEAALFSMLGILLSVFVTNVHLSLVSPMLISRIIEIIEYLIKLPFWLSHGYVYGLGMKLYLGFGGSIDGELFSVISAVYPFIFTFILSVLISLITYKAIALKLNSKPGVSE